MYLKVSQLFEEKNNFSPEMEFQSETLFDLLRSRALPQPNQRAFTFLIDRETEESHVGRGGSNRRIFGINSNLY